MNPIRIFVTFLSIIFAFGAVLALMTHQMSSEQLDPAQAELDLHRPRAPSESRAMKNPIPVSPAVVASGEALYLGKGNCFVCHGKTGDGNGEGGAMLNPPPRDLTNPEFQMLRTDGEISWSIQNGVPGAGMFAYVPRMISEEEAWKVVHYIRTLKRELRS